MHITIAQFKIALANFPLLEPLYRGNTKRAFGLLQKPDFALCCVSNFLLWVIMPCLFGIRFASSYFAYAQSLISIPLRFISISVRRTINIQNYVRLQASLHRPYFFIFAALVLNAYMPICFATSSAKFSSFFSIPSPVSKRTKPAILISVPAALPTCSRYLATGCFPSSALT